LKAVAREKRRGGSLAYVLVISTLAFLVAFVLAGTTSAHLQFANRVSRSQRARLLAEAAVAQAVSNLQNDPDFGSLGQSLRLELPGNPPGSEGYLGFDPAHEVFSTYNLQSDTSRPGYGQRAVPPYSVHLVGAGSCLGVSRKVEAIVTLPPFPYAIASSGPIISDGELLVGSLNGSETAGPITPETLSPAHLASNDSNAASIQLGPRTIVVGDVRSVGGMELSDGVVIKGQTLAYGQPVALPEVPLQSYDPELAQSGFQELPSEMTDATIQGTARVAGDLTVYGELRLDQAKLYVDGRLTVRGPLSGQGLVVASEGATIYTGARIAGGQAVLLSGDDVLIKGGGPLGSFFQGMVYCEGGFEASDITVVGSFVSRGEGAEVRLSNARVLGDSSVTSWTPTLVQTFHFVAGQRNNEPAVQVAGPTTDSFTIQVRVQNREDGPVWTVDDPRDGTTQVFRTAHAAARQVAVVANAIARDLRQRQGGGGDNLVAAAETLEAALTRLAEELAEESGQGFDINQFLSLSDRLRVVLWREL
jgi:hypothetical protein